MEGKVEGRVDVSKPSTEEWEFAAHLRSLLEQSRDGRAAMASLRRGLGKPAGTVYEMDRYVMTKLPKQARQGQEDAYYLVAALFAHWHQGKDKALENPPANMGGSLRRLVEHQVAAGADRSNADKTIERRLSAMLSAHPDELPEHLRRIVAILKAKDVPVNWAQLLHDLNCWERDSRSVQHEWARRFWIQGQGDAPRSERKGD